MFIEESRPAKIPNIEIETDLLISDLFSRMNRLIDDTLVLIKKEANNDELKIQEIKKSFFIGLEYQEKIRKESEGIDINDDAQLGKIYSKFPFNVSMSHLYLSTTLMQYNCFAWSMEEGNILEALEAVCNAFDFYGRATASIYSNDCEEMGKKTFFKFMADIRHAENRDKKAQVIQYYKDHKYDFKSKDDAAFHISNKIVNVSFSTARGYLKNI
jgi:hypothetical protein